MKKNCLVLLAALLFLLPAFSQNISINTDASLPNANAILDIKSGNKGLLIPRMSTAARAAIPDTKGLLVYDTTTNSFWYNTGAQWQAIASGTSSLSVADSAWLINGNSNVSDTANFLGTLNNVPLNIRVNNQRSGRIDPTRGNAYWGYLAGKVDTGSYNTAIGTYALQANTNGTRNTAGGAWSMYYNTVGYNNSSNGVYSMYYNTTGYANAALGYGSLNQNTTGFMNTASGYLALRSNTTGKYNTAVGVQALYSSDTLSGLTATGYQALYNNIGNYNTAYGFQSLYNNNQGFGNTATGYQASLGNGTGIGNTATGFQALRANNIGHYNTANGYQALYNGPNSSSNTAVGYQSMYFSADSKGNTGIGYQSLYLLSDGFYNTAGGFQALYNNSSTTGNTATGASALYSNTSGYYNTGIGGDALRSNTTGSNNTAIGFGADVSTGNLTNTTAVGYGSIVNASNKVRIGNAAVTVIEGQVPFTTPSDGRFKFNVQEDVSGLDFILHLRPVTYQFDTKRFDAQLSHQSSSSAGPANYAIQTAYDESSRIRRSGFIAQEVEKAANASGYDFSGIIRPKTDQDHYSLSYDAFVVPLVKAVQEQQQEIADLRHEVEELKKMIEHAK
jgi:hypothetical protein